MGVNQWRLGKTQLCFFVSTIGMGQNFAAWSPTFTWFLLPPALILLPRASRPPSIWPLALDCLGRESPGSNSPSLPRLPCSHAEILHCRACADTAFCPLGGRLAGPVTCRSVRRRARPSSTGAASLHGMPGSSGAVPAQISSLLGRTGWTSSWTHQATSGCSSPGIIPENYLLELADHHPQRGRPPHGVKKVRGRLEPSIARPPPCLGALAPPSLSLFVRATLAAQ